MQITAVEFIQSPAMYLDKVRDSVVTIIRDGIPIAVLAKPTDTPLTDSLLGLLKDSDVRTKEDIKVMRTGV